MDTDAVTRRRTACLSIAAIAALAGCAQLRSAVMGNAGAADPVLALHRRAAEAALAAELLAASHYDLDAARLALERARSGVVKSYARMLLNQYGALQGELAQLLRARDAGVPDGPPPALRLRLAQLGALDADAFDRGYIRMAGVEDQAARVRLLERMQAETDDAQLKAWLARFLPMVRGQQWQAESIAAVLVG
jgi:putative membrane protein